MQGIVIGMPVAIALSGLMAGIVVWALARWPLDKSHIAGRPSRQSSNYFLFREGLLVDHDITRPGTANDPLFGISGWPQLKEWLGHRFIDLPDDLPAMQAGEVVTFPARDPHDEAQVTISVLRHGHRVTLIERALPMPAEWHDAKARLAFKRLHRMASENAPIAISILDHEGKITWRNAIFQEFSDKDEGEILAAVASPNEAAGHPVVLTDPQSGRQRHVDLTSIDAGDRHILYANDVTELVNTDAMRSSFIQTLTKTFADLATGLAVFDRGQRLVLFNPALVDLTGLPVEFLSSRPGLLDFFDRLRDRQVLPEPKNYATWRAQINEMIETASDGHYAEAWTLPNGLTYRVTGRPHPDGAIAFLIEDITDEISFSRRTKSQLEIRQAVLDRLDTAIAVIGPNDILILCNDTFRERLGIPPDDSFAETSLDEIVRTARSRFPNDNLWADILAGSVRSPIEGRAGDDTTGRVHVRTEPLPGGFTMLNLTPD